jgi:hypothetical protein
VGQVCEDLCGYLSVFLLRFGGKKGLGGETKLVGHNNCLDK